MKVLHRVPKKGLKTTGMLGKQVPDFSLASTRTTFRLCALRAAKPVPYFYPKDKQRKVRGIERSSFLIHAEELLAREWRGVKVPGHAQEVSNFVKAL